MINILACPYPELSPVFSLIKYVINAIKIVAPILLVVYGIVDLVQAVIAKNGDEMSKKASLLIKRVIYAIAIFFVILFAQLFTSLLVDNVGDDKSSVKADSWLECLDLEDN